MRTAWIWCLLVAVAGCRLEEVPQGATTAGRSADDTPASFALGDAATPAQLAAWDTDVSGAGSGLPPGSGDATRGAALYRAQCASCHGANGEGVSPNPALIGAQPRDSFPFARNPELVKTIGNYWPYAGTLFDYIRRTMPLNAPGSLRDDEVYSLAAFLLARNGIIEPTVSLDSATLARVRMPARDRFVRDDRRGGPVIR